MATHPVKLYSNEQFTQNPSTNNQRFRLLKAGIADLISKGRAVLSAECFTEFDIRTSMYKTSWGYWCVYIGRRSVLDSALRRSLRKGHKEFNPFVIPFEK